MAWIKPDRQRSGPATDNYVSEEPVPSYPYVVRYVNSTGGANAEQDSAWR